MGSSLYVYEYNSCCNYEWELNSKENNRLVMTSHEM